MKYRNRQIEEQFYTFLDFDNHHQGISLIWKINPKLLMNLQKIKERENEQNISEKYLVELLIDQIKNNPQNPISKLHISAYLDDTCYWLGIKTHDKVRNFDYTWLDCFQIARRIINESESLIHSYESNRSSFKTYVKLKLETYILEIIHFNHEIEKYSPLGLLRKISKKKLKESLLNKGILTQNIDKYLLAFNILKLFYKPKKANGNKNLSWLTQEDLIFLVKQYNQRSNQSSITPEELESILLFSVEAIRRYAKPELTPIEELNQDLSSQIMADDLWETESNLTQWQQVKSILIAEYSGFQEEVKHIFDLIFGLNYTQTDVAKFLNYQPSQISRLVSRHKQQLFKQVVKKLQVNFTKQELKDKAESLNHWLNWYCQSKYHQILKQELVNLMTEYLSLLKSYIINEGNQAKIAENLDKKESEIEQSILNIYQHLSKKLREKIKLKLDSDTLDKKLINLVQKWLLNAPIAILETQISSHSNADSSELEN